MEVRLSDGTVARFPDGTPPEVIKSALDKRFGQGRPKPNPDGTYGEVPEGMVFDPERQAYTSRELLRGQIEPSRTDAFFSGLGQGVTFGAADELAGAFAGEVGQERARAFTDVQKEAHPVAYGVGNVAGITGSAMAVAPATATIRGAAGVAGATGAVQGALEAEGGAQDRIEGAIKGGGAGLLFGGLTAGLFKGANYGLRRAFQVAETRPSVQTLQNAKNAAYTAVRRSGFKFSGNETQRLYNRLARLGKTADFQLDDLADTDKAAFDALRKLELRSGKPITLNNLDKVRQSLWTVYSKHDHPFVLRAIEGIDELIASKAQGNEVMQAARLANSKFAKAQLLENAFRKAELQTAGTGSGGNILNKYRQAVTRIITTPREAKWFTPDEIAIMESFVRGDATENVLRRIGKLSPGGNGLMTALNVYAAAVDPTMLAVTAGATAAKGAADNSAMRGSEAILDAVTGFTPTPAPSATLPAVAGGAAANRLFD